MKAVRDGDGGRGPKRGPLRHGAVPSTLAQAIGTNGLNFVFCNTSAPSLRAVFMGTHAPAIYFVVIFLGLTFLRPSERKRACARTHTRALTTSAPILLFYRCLRTRAILPHCPADRPSRSSSSLLPISARFET